MHEVDVRVQPVGQLAADLEGLVGEVHGRDVGALPGPRDRVQPDVALQVQEVLAGDVTERGPLQRAQAALPGPERVEAR